MGRAQLSAWCRLLRAAVGHTANIFHEGHTTMPSEPRPRLPRNAWSYRRLELLDGAVGLWWGWVVWCGIALGYTEAGSSHESAVGRSHRRGKAMGLNLFVTKGGRH